MCGWRNAAIKIHTLLGLGNIALGNVGRHRQVSGAFRPNFGGFALLLQNGVIQELQVHIIAHAHHITGLLRPQQIARAANLQVPHGNFEAGAELHILPL